MTTSGKILKSAPTNREQFNVCIFCGSNPGNDPVYKKQAIQIANGLADAGIGLVYGGASVGIMGLLADTVLKKEGKVIGVIPQALVDKEVAHPGLTELRVVKTMHERKKLMFDLTDVFLTFPGGFGTLDETFEIVTWKQIGIHQKPLVMVNTNGFYTSLIGFIEQSVSAGFIKKEHRELFEVADDAESALKRIAQFRTASR